MKKSAALCLSLVAAALCTPGLHAQQHRTLWIAKFECDIKAASAVAAVQSSDASALQYSSLFDKVTTFSTDTQQPAGTWSLIAKETDFSGGSAAARALIGYGAGRAHIQMEYQLHDPSGKVVWTQKIKTKPPFWGAMGAVGAVQNQGEAESEQAQKLTEALAKFFGVAPSK
ncbi:MAG: DUF4410 domain-containing protein [Acidobacteriota bacterium]